MKRKILSALICLAMLGTMTAVSALAENTDTKTDEDYEVSLFATELAANLTYELDSAGTLTISGTGDMSFTGSTMSFGKAPWYGNCEYIKKVVVEEGVTSIAETAFYGCTNLETVELPSTLTKIEKDAFEGCQKLQSISIPDSVNTIGSGAFEKCSALKSIALPSSVTSISSRTFYECSELEAITMSRNVTSIGEYAFFECSKLKAIELPEGLKTIDESAFSNCSSFSHVKIPGTVETIGNSVFRSCSSITYVEVDEGVKSLSSHMFSHCSRMTSITLPQTLETVGNSAFLYCESLATVYYTGNKAKWNTITITSGNTYLTNATMRYNTIRDNDLRYYFIGANNDILKVDCLAVSANTISPDAFKDNAKIRAVLIPARVLAVGDNAFSGCENLEKVYYTEGEDDWKDLDIGEGNEALTDAVLFANATQSGDNVIYRYTDADSKNLLISGCGPMPEYASSGDVSPWRSSTVVINAEFEEGVTTVGSRTFTYASALKSATLSDTITSINQFAFYGCSAMTDITIPASVTEIQSGAFDKCTALCDIYYTGTKAQWKALMSNTAEDNDVFTANGVTVHYEVKDLGGFKWWIAEGGILEISGTGVIPDFTEENPSPWGEDIKGVIIPSTVKGIGANAFAGCENVEKVYYKADGISWKEINIAEGNDAISAAAMYYNATREDNIIWTYSNNKDAVLTISGAGEIKDYTGKDYAGKTYTASWANYAASAKKIVIEDGITTAGMNAFKGFTAVTSAVLPEGMTEIHESAFEGCSALAEAAIPSAVEYIDKNAFKGTAITSVTIPDGITEIPYGVFENCAKLSGAALPDSVTAIADCAFKNCSALRSIDVPDTVTSIGESAFENCSALRKIIVPAGVQSLPERVFSGCRNLETVIAHEKIKSIGNKAFYGCDKITDVYYAGAEDEWGFITIDNGNDALINAAMHYEYTVLTSTTYKVDEITPTETGVTITVQTNRVVPDEQTVMVACYDENGVFIGLKEQKITASDTVQDISVDIDKTNTKTVKAFIWNAVEYMMPASKMKSWEL